MCAGLRVSTATAIAEPGAVVLLSAGAGPARISAPCRAGRLVLWQVGDDDHPLMIGGQWLSVLAVAGHGSESCGE
jgi:hypothetical protein